MYQYLVMYGDHDIAYWSIDLRIFYTTVIRYASTLILLVVEISIEQVFWTGNWKDTEAF